MAKEIFTIEMKIKSRIREVKAGTLNPSESGLGVLFKRLKELDEASYSVLIQKYKLV